MTSARRICCGSGFTPLYLRYVDVWDALDAVADVLATRAWDDPAYVRGVAAVT